MFGRGNTKGKPATVARTSMDEAERPEDDLGRFPNEVDSNPSETRSQERALRAVSIVAIVAGMMCVALIMLLIEIFPLQKVYPYLVTFKNQDNQVVSIEPMSATAPGALYATEDAVRDYVTQRHSFTPSKDIMTAQWGPGSRLAARTAQDAYTRFANAYPDEMSRMIGLGYARTITIQSVNRIAADTWQVNFTTHDQLPTSGGTLTAPDVTLSSTTPAAVPTPSAAATNAATPTPGGPVTAAAPPPPTVSARGFGGSTVVNVNQAAAADGDEHWVATMRVAFLPQNVTYDKRLLNPLGFTVIEYSVTRSTR